MLLLTLQPVISTLPRINPHPSKNSDDESHAKDLQYDMKR